MIINISELDQFMKLQRVETELKASLNLYLEQQEFQLKRLEKIKTTAQYLSNFRDGTYNKWFKQVDPEIKKYIIRYRNR